MRDQIKCRLLKPGKWDLIALKKEVLLSVLLLLSNIMLCFGQTLTVNPSKPAKGELISFIYDPKGGKFENDTLKSLTVIVTDGFDQTSKQVDLIKEGAVYHGTFQPDSGTLLLIFAVSFNKVWDSAPESGYIYPIYENGQPVSGALTASADFYISRSMKTIFGAEPNYQKAMDLLKEEMKLYPDGKYKLAAQQKYYQALYKLNSGKGRAEILSTIRSIDQQQYISDIDHYKKYRLYEILDMKVEMESTLELIARQFPNSPVIFSRRYKDALTPRAAAEMEVAANKLIEDYNMINGKEFSSLANSVFRALDEAYLKELNLPKFYLYIDKLSDLAFRLIDLISAARFFAETKRELPEAEKIANRALRLIDTLTSVKPSLSPQRLKEKKNEVTGLLGRIYYEQGQFDQAYALLKTAYQENTEKQDFIPIYYGLALVKKGEFKTAKPLLAEAIRQGRTDDEIILAFKEAFISDGGNLTNYTTQLASLKEEAQSAKKSTLEKVKLNIPAPNFTLPDNKGKRVSLSDYKGKVVVLDFWATWCIPCLEAFPGMNKLITKYQNDKDVVFLFINTSETFTKDLTKRINTYLKEQGYNFHVLIDEKRIIDGGNQYISKALYNASAIPLKVVIDKAGNIRFKSTGYLGSDELVVEELSGFIEAAKL